MRITVAALLVCAVGCEHAIIKIDELAAELAAAKCDADVACVRMPDVATCFASHTPDAMLLSVVAEVHAGTVQYDAVRGAECVDYIRANPCMIGDGSVIGSSDPSNPCSEMFLGTLINGEACNESAQCGNHGIDGFCVVLPPCNPTFSCCSGTCATGGKPLCGDANCSVDDYCHLGQCTPRVTDEGGACDTSDACAPPLACTGIGRTSSHGTCVRVPQPSPTGGSCPCLFPGDYCDATNTCAHGADAGAACGGSQHITCVGYADCIGSPVSTCIARPLVGAACTALSGNSQLCLGDATCVNSVCTLPTTTPCPELLGPGSE